MSAPWATIGIHELRSKMISKAPFPTIGFTGINTQLLQCVLSRCAVSAHQISTLVSISIVLIAASGLISFHEPSCIPVKIFTGYESIKALIIRK